MIKIVNDSNLVLHFKKSEISKINDAVTQCLGLKNSCASGCRPSLEKPPSLKFLLTEIKLFNVVLEKQLKQ